MLKTSHWRKQTSTEIAGQGADSLDKKLTENRYERTKCFFIPTFPLTWCYQTFKLYNTNIFFILSELKTCADDKCQYIVGSWLLKMEKILKSEKVC